MYSYYSHACGASTLTVRAAARCPRGGHSIGSDPCHVCSCAPVHGSVSALLRVTDDWLRDLHVAFTHGCWVGIPIRIPTPRNPSPRNPLPPARSIITSRSAGPSAHPHPPGPAAAAVHGLWPRLAGGRDRLRPRWAADEVGSGHGQDGLWAVGCGLWA